MSDESILGLDNIRLELPVAGVGIRVLAGALDYLVLVVLQVGWTLAGTYLFAGLGSWGIAVVVFGAFLLDWGYFAGSEIAAGGRTLGKRALRLRVVTAEGGTPASGALLARNLVRLFDLLVGVPLMALDPLARRLGDRLGGTLVIHARREEAALLLGRVPPGWGPRELAVVESLLARADDLENPAQVWTLADRILAAVERDAPEMLAGIERRSDPVRALRQAFQTETR